MTTMNRFFVYGTLRPGESRWPAIYQALASDPIPAYLESSAMFNMGSYPAIVIDPKYKGSKVIGDLVEIQPGILPSIIRYLDSIEGYYPIDHDSSLYIRELQNVITDNGPVNAWVYCAGAYIQRTINGGGNRIQSGDWKKR
jgi:gamma-glutamylcyclotransferase (GGCT)/AIG2-like uncharacterized protein YtfP